MKKISFITLFILFIFGLSANAQKKTFTETVNGVSFKMIYVEGGTFTMGATPEQNKHLKSDKMTFYYNLIGSDIFDDEYPAHKVSLDSYFIGETEVSQELWDAVMDVKCNQFFDENFYECFFERETYFTLFKIGKRYPMHTVSWYDAQKFCDKLSQLTGRRYCLPTEAQWEYAARGGKYSKKYIYSGGNNENAVNNEHLKDVKSSKPNELGIYNMSGNVREWCYDWYGEYPTSKQNNPTGSTFGDSKVIRGRRSCSAGPAFDMVVFCRISCRDCDSPNENLDNGFRIALVPGHDNKERIERDGYEWVSLKGESNLCGAQVGGKVIVPAEYSEVEYMPYYGGYFIVGNGKYIGAYDCTGKYLIPIDRCYSSIYKTCSDGRYYYRVGKGNKYGACDLNGVEIVKPIYHDLILYNGVFIYRDGSTWIPLSIGLNSENEVVENPQYSQTAEINYDIALKQSRLEEVFGKNVKVEQVATEDGHRAFKIVFENQILFEFGKSTLNAQAIKYIEQVAGALKSLPSTKVIVTGYTDNVGSLESNKRVSNNRAKAVSDRLAMLGVARTRLSAQGVPLADYVATNETEEGRALNRRVEIVIEPTE